MKKIAMFTLLAMTGVLMVNAQKLNPAAVPAKVKAAFAKPHPGITAKWEKENDVYEAGFKLGGKSISELYTAGGTMTESETDIKIAGLPSTVQGFVKSHYKGAGIKEAAKITKSDGTVNYEAEVNKTDLIFDANGKFLKEVKD